MTDPAAFRSHFPVLERVAYLNAGTEGPLPSRAADAVAERLQLELSQGRSGPAFFDEVKGLAGELRDRYAALLGCGPSEVALTGSTTDGINTILSGLDLHEGDEILTSDQEHPGLLAPLGRARLRHGVVIRTAPFDELAGAISPATRLIACSHVSWVNGAVMDVPALTSTGVPVLLDAAQALGAVPVDVRALGCDFYAASGQKWLCGPEGSGCLYARAERIDDLVVPWPGYGSLADPERPLDFAPAESASRFDHGFPPALRSVQALAALSVLEEAGWEWVHARAVELARGLAGQLAERGLEVAPRGDSTLVSWRADDAPAEVTRLAEARFVLRSVPGAGLVRASVGAWSSEDELARLVAAAAP